MTAIIPVE